MAKILQYFFLSLIVWCSVQAKGQQSCKLVVLRADSADNLPAIKENFSSKASCMEYVTQLPSLFISKGFAAASVDSVWQDSTNIFIKFFSGEKYIWDSLYIKNEDWLLLSQLGYLPGTFNNKPFDQARVNKVYEQLLDYFEANGYPFAKIFLDSISIQENKLRATLVINKGAIYYLDSISVKGNIRINRNFLYRYLDMQPHEYFNRAKFDKINARLAELPFIAQTQPWNVEMLNTGSVLNLYLENRRSNQADVLIGLLPANEQLGGKLLFTGEATLNLKNSFGGGETIGLHWQQLQSSSPRLNLLFQKPYIFNSRFGFNFNFELYKKDSSYVNINGLFGVQYVLSSQQAGSVFFRVANTNLLDVDTNTVKFSKQLPPIIDMSTTGLALQYSFNNTNYRFNPRRGNELLLNAGFGKKTIRKNNSIIALKDTFNYAALYDTVKLHSYQFSIVAEAAHYFPIGEQSALKAAINAGWYQSPNYFQNELFQLGGYKLLRGFDEESIYANKYGIATLEYHYLLGQNSWFYGFTDFGWTRYEAQSVNFSHSYLGFGIGLALETKTGIFNISLAEGKRNDSRLNFRQSKIHLGFVSIF